jgi:hypothetical protein
MQRYCLKVALSVLLSVSFLPAEDEPPVRILKGELIEWEARGLSGDFSLRDAQSRVHRCQFSPDTYLKRQTLRVTPTGVKPGDYLEVVADIRNGAASCRAVTIYIRASDPARLALGRGGARSLPTRIINDNLWPRGSLTFSGVVQRLETNRMVVQTRLDGAKTFHLRDDTLYSEEGRLVQRGRLEVHTRVFVRAGRGFEGEMEAYQIVWGGIVSPRETLGR